jgi:hypothetical protein
MSNRGSDRRQAERRKSGERRNQSMPVERDQRSGEVRRNADRRIGIDRRDS